MLLKLSFREILNQRKFTLFFIFNISIGLLGPVILENFKEKFEENLSKKSKSLLGADLGLRSRRPITQKEINVTKSEIKKVRDETSLIDLFSMARSEEVSRLVSIRIIDKNYPFYGVIRLKNRGPLPLNAEDSDLFKKNKVWIYPELKIQLGIDIGSKIYLGKAVYEVEDIVTEDSGQVFQVGSLAPRIFMSQASLNKADLLKVGSTARYTHLYKIDPTIKNLETLKANLLKKIDDPAVKIVTAKGASEQVGRVITYLNDFLGLISLVALFLAYLALFYLYRSFLSKKKKDMAIYYCLGLRPKKLLALFSLHLFILGLIGSLLAILFGMVASPIILKLISGYIPFSIDSQMGLNGIFASLLIGIIGNFLLGIPLLIPILKFRPSNLFLEGGKEKSKLSSNTWVFFLPFIIFCWILSIVISHSYIIGTLFMAIFFGLGLILLPAGLGGLNFLEKNFHPRKLYLKLAFQYLCRFKFTTTSIFITLVLGTMLINIIPQIEHNIQSEIKGPKRKEIPSLFLFDIQEEQVAPLKVFLEKEGVSLKGLSPLVRGRLVKLNGKKYQHIKKENEINTRENERSARFRNRGLNLSYRETFNKEEKIIEGRKFNGTFNFEKNSVSEISIEKRFAKRMGISIGDILEFNILDMPVISKVVSLRKVRWTSFLPNFFVQFQPGVLENAPKTFLSAIPFLESDLKSQIQLKVFKLFPNISMVDVSRLVERIFTILKQVGWALKIMTMMSFLIGLLVIYSISNHQIYLREKDLSFLKVIGVPLKTLKRMIRFEFFILTLFGSGIGALLGVGVSYFISKTFFDGIWSFLWWFPPLSILVISFLCLLTSEVATRTVLNKRGVLSDN